MLVKEKGKQIDFKVMDKAQKHNSDGYGVSWYEDGIIKTYKTFNYNTFKGIVASLKDYTVVAHLRYATKGKKDYNNIHPFDTNNGVLFHNGTISGFGDIVKSDTAEFADILKSCEYEYIKDIEPLIKHHIKDKINRLVFFEEDGNVTILNSELGIKEDGIWYSNDYHLKDESWCRGGLSKCNTLPREYEYKYEYLEDILPEYDTEQNVFVYGTLKRGYGNNRLLKDSTFLGKAKTKKKWAMIGAGAAFPYLLTEDDEGHYVEGEVYSVTDKVLRSLDTLEGVPHHYIAQDIEIVYEDDGSVDWALVYRKSMFNADYKKDNVLISKWIR
jgi:gamma-glutamylcyclotransferase (GGCT)/AIG2-like uncharacterized protein YtfP